MKKVLATLLILVTLVVAGTTLAAARAWITCSTCNGSGRCTACVGSGQSAMPGPSGEMMLQSCPACVGSGRCSSCGGNGGRYYP